MQETQHRIRLLRRLALACAVMVLAVVSLSAYLRLSKAGLGCGDWPPCYGQSLRQLQQGLPVLAEAQSVATAAARLAHRVVAVLALVLVVLMVVLCWSERPALRSEFLMALTLLALALFLAVLGRWSSQARVPAVTLGNLLGGFAMFALCVRLACTGQHLAAPQPRTWALAALALLVLQLALGGMVSASFAGLSCSGWLDCFAAAPQADLATLNPWHEPVLGPAGNVNPDGTLVNALHRSLALMVVALLVPVAALAWRGGRPRTALALFALLVAQAGVGLAFDAGPLPMALALLHNLLGAGLLATLVLLVAF